MPTEEDLKAIVVHKKYSSSRKSKSDGRKRKRSTSSGSSNSSISSANERKPEKPENKDAGFIPSRFLKDKHRSSSRRRDEEPAHPAYKDRRDSLKKREDRREERREDRSRDDRSRDDRRDDRDRPRHYEEDDRRRERDHEITRRDDRNNEEQSRSSKYDYKPSSSFYRNKEHDFYKPSRKGDDFDLRRKTKDENKRSSSHDDKRKNRREDDEDYDPISDEELAMLEEDAGIIEIYRELEREMRSKRYTANLDDIDFGAVDVLKCKAKEVEYEDAISRLIKCGFSSNYGGKVLTEKIKALAAHKGVEAPLNGAFSANKKTVRSVFQATLSPHIALSSNTDLLLRQRLSQLSRDNNERELVLTEEPVNNTLLADSVRMFNQLAGTSLDVK